MLVRPIDFNGMIQNTNGVAQSKSNEDAKPELQQNMMQIQANEQEQVVLTQVHTENKLEEEDTPDDGGDGTGYTGNHGEKSSKKKEKQKIGEGRVIKKGAPAPFNITI